MGRLPHRRMKMIDEDKIIKKYSIYQASIVSVIKKKNLNYYRDVHIINEISEIGYA